MSPDAKTGGREKVQSRKPWRKPGLTVHGDLRGLTQAKGGLRNDGGGKPRTRASGKLA